MHLDLGVLLASVAPAAGALVLDTVLGVAQAVKAGGLKAINLQTLAHVAEKAVTPLIVGVGGTLVQGLLSGGGAVTAATVVIAISNTVTARALADVKAKATALLG